jgi:hypothetical protein
LVTTSLQNLQYGSSNSTSSSSTSALGGLINTTA